VDAARLIAAVVALTLLSSPRPLDFAGAGPTLWYYSDR